jgi:hypothetical protein
MLRVMEAPEKRRSVVAGDTEKLRQTGKQTKPDNS